MTIILSCLALVGCECFGSRLDEALESRILEDFLITTAMLGDIAPEEIDYTFFGQYGDSIAIYFHTAGAYDTKTEEKAAGIKFKYPDSRTIKIWNNGKLYKMPEAFEKGLISKEDVLSIKLKSLFLNHKEPCFIYNSKRITEVPIIFYEKPDIFYWNMLEVILDENVSRVNSVPSVEFFGADIVKEVIDISAGNDRTDKTFEQHIALILYEDTPEELYEVRKRIEQIDGVKSVLFCDNMISSAANDNYYANNFQWGLNNIEVEKVWNFTTGTNDIFVGVIDHGVNLHTSLSKNSLFEND